MSGRRSSYGESVIITTTKPGKYDRYLADAHLIQPDGEVVYLNHALLAGGHAVRMDPASPANEEGAFA